MRTTVVPPVSSFAVAAVAVVVLLASACTKGGSRAVPRATVTTVSPTTVPAPTTTVAASPRTTVTLPSELGPGPAHVAGTVSGPEGVVGGATVRVERLVDDTAVAATTVQTGVDGHWAVDSVNGGRYRLRAWKPPDLAQLTPAVVFVAVDDAKPIDLPMLRYPANADAVASVVPNPPVVGQPAIAVVGIANGGVDAEGILHTQGRPGVAVTLGVSTNVTITTLNPNSTDGNGNAGFQIVCNQVGPITGVVTVGTAAQQPIQLPACVAA